MYHLKIKLAKLKQSAIKGVQMSQMYCLWCGDEKRYDAYDDNFKKIVSIECTRCRGPTLHVPDLATKKEIEQKTAQAILDYLKEKRRVQ